MKLDDFIRDLELSITACKSDMDTSHYQRLDKYINELRQSYRQLVSLLKKEASYRAALYRYLLEVRDLPYTDEVSPKIGGKENFHAFYTEYIQLEGEVVGEIKAFKGIYEALIEEFQFPYTLLGRVLFNLKNWFILWLNYISYWSYFTQPYLPYGNVFPTTYAFQMKEGYNMSFLKEATFSIYQRNSRFLQLLQKLLSQAEKKIAMRKDDILPLIELNEALERLRSEKPWVMPQFVITAFHKLRDRTLSFIEPTEEQQGIACPDTIFIQIKEICLELRSLLDRYASIQFRYPIEETDSPALCQETIDQFCRRLPGTLSLERYFILPDESNLNSLSEDSKKSIFSNAQSIVRTASQLQKNTDSLSQILVRAITDLQGRFTVKLSLVEIPGARAFFNKLIEQDKKLTEILNSVEKGGKAFSLKFFSKSTESIRNKASQLESDFIYWKQSLPLAFLRENNFFPLFDYRSTTNSYKVCGFLDSSTELMDTTPLFFYTPSEASDISSLSSSSSSYVF